MLVNTVSPNGRWLLCDESTLDDLFMLLLDELALVIDCCFLVTYNFERIPDAHTIIEHK